MRPNWFIGFPVQVDVSLPEPPRRVRLFAPEDRHMTLAFLGDVDEDRGLAAWNALGAFRRPPVSATFGQIKLLGNPRKPSAVTALVEGDAAKTLEETIGAWRSPLFDAASVPHETRPPLPHVTVARIQRRASRDEYTGAKTWAQSLQVSGASFTIDQVALYTWSKDRKQRLFQIVKHRAIDD